MKDISSDYGFRFVAEKVDAKNVIKKNKPCILHWNYNHFVVFEKSTKNSVFILDPYDGKKKVTIKDLINSYSGFCAYVYLEEHENSIIDTSHDSRYLKKITNLLKYSKFDINKFLVFLFLSILIESSFLILPFFSKFIIDFSISNNNSTGLVHVILLSVFLVLVLGSSITIRGIITSNMSSGPGFFISSKIIDAICSLTPSQISTMGVGNLTARLSSIDKINSYTYNMLIYQPLSYITIVTSYLFMVLMLSLDQIS